MIQRHFLIYDDSPEEDEHLRTFDYLEEAVIAAAEDAEIRLSDIEDMSMIEGEACLAVTAEGPDSGAGDFMLNCESAGLRVVDGDEEGDLDLLDDDEDD